MDVTRFIQVRLRSCIYMYFDSGNLYQSVTAVPAYLPDLKFSIVKSIKGYTEVEYHHFLSVADQFVREHIKFDHTFGNTGKQCI